MAKRQIGAAKRRAKESDDKARVELELLIDELIQEGVDPRSPVGQEFLAQAIARRCAQTAERHDDWPWKDVEF